MKNLYFKNVINNTGKMIVTGKQLDSIINITGVFSILYLKYTTAYRFEGEKHDLWELVYVDSGEITLQSDNTEKILTQSQFYLHAPNEFHKIRANNQNCNVIIFSFDSSSQYLYTLINTIHQSSYQQRQILNYLLNYGKNLFPQNNPFEQKETTEFDIQMTKNYIEIFFLLCSKSENDEPIKNTEYNNTLIQEVVNYFSLNLSSKITFTTLSEHIGYSPSYISKIFKKYIGKSVFSYLYEMRINKAKELIAYNKFNFQKISEIIGFDNLQYFSTQFKKSTSMTPSQYVKSVKTTNLINPLELEKIDYRESKKD